MYSLQSIGIYDVLTLDSDSGGILLLLHKDRQEFMRGVVLLDGITEYRLGNNLGFGVHRGDWLFEHSVHSVSVAYMACCSYSTDFFPS